MALLAQTNKLLADLPGAQRPQVIMISVDPERDTPERLGAVREAFDPTFVGVDRHESRDRRARADAWACSSPSRPLEASSYTVDHSASMFLIDPDGALRALFSPPHSAEADRRRLSADRERRA